MAAISKACGFFLPWIIWLTLIFCINLNFLVSSFCLLNHCVVKVVVAIIVYKRPMFINPWNGFSPDLDICCSNVSFIAMSGCVNIFQLVHSSIYQLLAPEQLGSDNKLWMIGFESYHSIQFSYVVFNLKLTIFRKI